MNSIERINELKNNFNYFSNWEEKYKYIISKGKELPSMDGAHKTDDYLITGCQSKVWLHPTFKDGIIIFKADSDASITKGIAAILLEIYSPNTPSEILKINPDFITELELTKHLSATRSNGLASMIKQITIYAMAFKTLEKK